jgi:hypothetical protein
MDPSHTGTIGARPKQLGSRLEGGVVEKRHLVQAIGVGAVGDEDDGRDANRNNGTELEFL